MWTAAELRMFLAGVESERLHPLFLVLATTGMRRGEALGGRWDDVDLEGARWRVRRTLLPIDGQPVEGTPKSARGLRSVALDPGTVRVLKQWRTTQLAERLAWGAAWTDTGRVFTREDGTDLHPARVSERFNRLDKRSGLPRVRLHDLRHGHATLALAADVHPKVVQERLGHSSVANTLDRYSHVGRPCRRTRQLPLPASSDSTDTARLQSVCSPACGCAAKSGAKRRAVIGGRNR